MVLAVSSSLNVAHYLGNVRTWAISVLRHLANMSSMVPFWASTDSGFVPNLGPRVRSHAVWKRLFIFLMTAAHISPNVFSLRNFLSNIHVLFPLYIHRHSYLLYITFIRAIYIIFIYITFRFTISAALHGRPAALGPLCPLQVVPLTATNPTAGGLFLLPITESVSSGTSLCNGLTWIWMGLGYWQHAPHEFRKPTSKSI